MRWVALMPLRGGSKAIPGKNVKMIAGRPLFSWSLSEAIASECFDEIHVATDDEEIRRQVAKLFPQVEIFERSVASATDHAPTELVMEEFQARRAFDVLCLIQATSPFTRANHIREAREKFEAEGLDALVTVARLNRFFWSDAGEPLNYDPVSRPRRQDLSGQLTENGAFYFTKAQILRRQHTRLAGKTGVYEMPSNSIVEVDEPVDWVAAEYLLRREIAANWAEPGRRVEVLVLDVDGTLTDGGMYYGATGEAMKKFDTRDAKGLQLLRESGVRLAVITGENSAAVTARMRKLRIDDYHPGIENKLPLLKRLAAEWEVPLTNIAYMGDDVGDAACLQHAGFRLCPANAVPEIMRLCDYITTAPAGAGAVREACDLILSLNAGATEPTRYPQ